MEKLPPLEVFDKSKQLCDGIKIESVALNSLYYGRLQLIVPKALSISQLLKLKMERLDDTSFLRKLVKRILFVCSYHGLAVFIKPLNVTAFFPTRTLGSSYLIVGNTRLVLVEQATARITSFVFGRDDSELEKEIKMRKYFPETVQAKLVYVDVGQRIVTEELLRGDFLTRLNTTKFDSKITSFLAKNGEAVCQRNSNEAIAVIKNACRLMEISVKGLSIDLVSGRLMSISCANLSVSHGDAHRGNIIIENGSFYFIDWEFSAVRFQYYDYFVFDLGLRTKSGIEDFNTVSFLCSIKKLEKIVGVSLDASTAYYHLITEELVFRSELYQTARDSQSLKMFSREIACKYLKMLGDTHDCPF